MSTIMDDRLEGSIFGMVEAQQERLAYLREMREEQEQREARANMPFGPVDWDQEDYREEN
jgi:hypothetical protein